MYDVMENDELVTVLHNVKRTLADEKTMLFKRVNFLMTNFLLKFWY